MFFEFQEKTASTELFEVFVNVYSMDPAGKLELSASPGINGLHPEIFTFNGKSLSDNSIVANGNLARNRQFSNLGNP
jgi:hypothetical protein